MQINNKKPRFTETLVSHRQKKKDLLSKVDEIINWSKYEVKLKEHYEISKKEEGESDFPALVLFKMLLIQLWYDLSDFELEYQCIDRHSFRNFIGIPLELKVPDHSSISRFKAILAKQGVFDLLLNDINEQLEKNNIIVKKGVFVNASLTITK